MEKNEQILDSPAGKGIAIIGLLAFAIFATKLVEYPLLQTWNLLPLGMLIADFFIARKIFYTKKDRVEKAIPMYSLKKEDPVKRYQQALTFIRVCRPTEWVDIFDYIDLSTELGHVVDTTLVHNAVFSVKMDDLVTLVEEKNQVTWNPIHIERAARLISEAMESPTDNKGVREVEIEWLVHTFRKLINKADRKIGYVPLMNIFKKEELVSKLLNSI